MFVSRILTIWGRLHGSCPNDLTNLNEFGRQLFALNLRVWKHFNALAPGGALVHALTLDWIGLTKVRNVATEWGHSHPGCGNWLRNTDGGRGAGALGCLYVRSARLLLCVGCCHSLKGSVPPCGAAVPASAIFLPAPRWRKSQVAAIARSVVVVRPEVRKMPGSLVPLCTNHSRHRWRMFSFPREHKRRLQWTVKIRRDKWQPINTSRVCSVSELSFRSTYGTFRLFLNKTFVSYQVFLLFAELARLFSLVVFT